MPASYRLYNHTAKLILNQELVLTAIKVMLLSDTAPAFDAAHSTLEEVAGVGLAHEVHGNGWTQGGELVANVAGVTVNTDDASLQGDDITKLAAGGPIGPARHAVVLFDSGSGLVPLANIDFGENKQAGDTTNFKIRWPVEGILAGNYTPPA